jgi:ABC-type nitrate/sulfonate/bicarbonate transport system permease component
VQILVLAAALGVWEFATVRADQAFFPPPSTFLPRMRELWFSGPADHAFLTSDALANFGPSLAKLAAGWAVASLAGVAAGLALGRSRRLAQYLDPLLQLGRAVPPATLIPFFIVVFHLGTTMEIATIAFGVVWPVLLNTMDGARSVDPLQLDTARVFHLGPGQRLFRLILPGAAPKIFAGMRVAVSIALILMVIAEIMGGGTGIGGQLIVAQRTFDLPAMWGSIVILGVLGYLLNTVFLAVERRSLRWYRGAKQTEPL